MWAILGRLLLGALIGWLASKIMHGRGGLIRNIIVGIAGSVLGGWLADWVGIGAGNMFSFVGFLVALGGACLLIFLSRLISGRN